MIEINGSALTQWDVGRSVKITGIEVEYAHFANKGDSKAVVVGFVDIDAKIPDFLLQTGKELCVYAVKDGITVESKTFYVKKRERPENYVYEEDQRNYIYELITDAENAVDSANQAADRANEAAAKVEEYIAAGGIGGFSPIAKVTQTAEGATIEITDKNGTTAATVTNGKDGKDYVLTEADKKEIAGMVADGNVDLSNYYDKEFIDLVIEDADRRLTNLEDTASKAVEDFETIIPPLVEGVEDLTKRVTAIEDNFYDGSYTDIEDNPLPIEVTTEAEMNALLDTADIGSVYKYAEDAEDSGTYEKGALYIVEAVEE